MGLSSALRRHRKASLFSVVVFAFMLCVVLNAAFTGSYFSDSVNGTFGGNNGLVQVTPNTPMDLNFDNLVPGKEQVLTGSYTNTGSVPQDVYLEFTNATALSTLNNLGTYGSVTIVGDGQQWFSSQNLNDHASCPPGSTAGGNPPCDALPAEQQVAKNVQPGATIQVKFSFEYAAKLTGQGGGCWNSYPGGNGSGQSVVNASDGTGCGLPYKLTATQVGTTPA